MDMSYILAAAILLVGTVVTALAAWAWKKWVQPWIVDHHLEAEATIVVNAVEAILGRYTGEEKWQMALQKMQAAGWNIDADKVLDALRSAWELLNIKQISAGIKDDYSLMENEE